MQGYDEKEMQVIVRVSPSSDGEFADQMEQTKLAESVEKQPTEDIGVGCQTDGGTIDVDNLKEIDEEGTKQGGSYPSHSLQADSPPDELRDQDARVSSHFLASTSSLVQTTKQSSQSSLVDMEPQKLAVELHSAAVAEVPVEPTVIAPPDDVEDPSQPPMENIDHFLIDDPDDPEAEDVQTPQPLDAPHLRAPSLLAALPTNFAETPFTPGPES